MPGYTTQQRNCTRPLTWTLTSGAAPQTGTFNGSWLNGPGKQRTTSWRTQGDELGSDDADYYRNLLTAMRSDKSILLPHDVGHTFESTKQTTLLSHDYVKLDRPGVGTYTGPLALSDSSRTGSSTSRESWLNPVPVDLNAYGNRLLKAALPTNSVANLSISLAEVLREGIPAVIGTKLVGLNGLQERISHFRDLPKRYTYKAEGPHLRNASEEYLNYVFGYAPIVKEVRNLASLALQSSRMVLQYSRDSDRVVRRRREIPDEVTTEERDLGSLNGNNLLPNFLSGQFIYGGSVKMYTRTTRSTWFSGAFQYSLGSDDSILAQASLVEKQANHLLGLRLTPSVIWALTPWSWLADWFSSVGSVLQTASALQSDGLVIRYGYLMQTTTVERIIQASGVQSLSTWNPRAFATTYKSVRKERVRSTPFGFGLTDAQINEQQWSILGALGLTKAPKKLW